MVVSSAAVSLFILSLFAMLWMALRERVTRLDGTLPYHVATQQQDRRKGRFYFKSVWTGLLSAFVGMACLQVMANTLLNANNTRNVVNGVAYGLGLWGLLIISLVWSQIGQRTLEPNSDRKMLTPTGEREKEKGERRK